jgi:hypothetical protein
MQSEVGNTDWFKKNIHIVIILHYYTPKDPMILIMMKCQTDKSGIFVPPESGINYNNPVVPALQDHWGKTTSSKA